MDERALNELRRLAAEDSELSERAAGLRRLDGEVASIRARAESVDAFLVAYPEERTRRVAELSAAEHDLHGRRHELEEAERAVADAADDETREHAERARSRAVDHVAVAQSRLDRSEASFAEIERDAIRRPAELPELHDRASSFTEVTPPPDAGSLAQWASHVHAELFVALGQIDARRERVIREANELASMLLGETTFGATAEQALARVAAHWTSSPGQVSESR